MSYKTGKIVLFSPKSENIVYFPVLGENIYHTSQFCALLCLELHNADPSGDSGLTVQREKSGVKLQIASLDVGLIFLVLIQVISHILRLILSAFKIEEIQNESSSLAVGLFYWLLAPMEHNSFFMQCNKQQFFYGLYGPLGPNSMSSSGVKLVSAVRQRTFAKPERGRALSVTLET